MKQATAYLTLEVTYNLNGESPEAMAQYLQMLMAQAIAGGLLTGSSGAAVDRHDVTVDVLPAPLEEVDIEALEELMLERIDGGSLSLEDIPSRLVRYGLLRPAAFVSEMLERKALAREDAEELLDQTALTPAVQAEVHDDAFINTFDFDAAPWFAQASDEAILALHAIGWRGDDAADAVAQFAAKDIFEVDAIISICRGSQGTRAALGFECVVDEDSAMAWLKAHRPGLWARILCADNDVRLVEAQEPEIEGRWDWLDSEGIASEASCETEDEAALEAVRVLGLN